MLYKIIRKANVASGLVVASAVAGVLLSGCTNTGTNATANLNANASSMATTNTNANSAAATGSSGLEAKEPESYSATTIITVQPTGNAPQTNIPPLQFGFARMGTDRRISFKLPDPVGEVVYLEKPQLKYLIFPLRNQYVELDPDELGFQLGNLMSPASALERLKERTRYESLGTETLNGRAVVKYRFTGAADTRTKAGTAHADSVVFVDQETGLPLRTEIDTTSSSGAGARIVTATESLQLSPDSTLFEVPTQMKKVTSAELKQQVQAFVSGMRQFAGYLRQQMPPTQPAAGQR
jgi:outer membrane lipoprotein-sorting protein